MAITWIPETAKPHKPPKPKSVHWRSRTDVSKGIFACGVYTKAFYAKTAWLWSNDVKMVTCGRCLAQVRGWDEWKRNQNLRAL